MESGSASLRKRRKRRAHSDLRHLLHVSANAAFDGAGAAASWLRNRALEKCVELRSRTRRLRASLARKASVRFFPGAAQSSRDVTTVAPTETSSCRANHAQRRWRPVSFPHGVPLIDGMIIEQPARARSPMLRQRGPPFRSIYDYNATSARSRLRRAIITTAFSVTSSVLPCDGCRRVNDAKAGLRLRASCHRVARRAAKPARR